MPSERIQTEGGVGHGLRVWVNLPSSLRRIPPNYQALPRERLVSVEGDGHTAAIYAFDGAGSVGEQDRPLGAHHLAVFDRSGGDVVVSVPADMPQAHRDDANTFLVQWPH